MQSKIDFGKALKKNRKRLDMTQTQLAETIGVSVQAISQYERGQGSPTIRTVCRFASALGVSVSDLLYETDNNIRANVLLKACFDFLNKPRRPSTIYGFMKETVNYDEADHDGFRLMDDIKAYLEIGE